MRIPPTLENFSWQRDASGTYWLKRRISYSLREFFIAFIISSGIAAVISVFLYLPDFLIDYSQRDTKFLAFFGVFFAGIVAFAAAIASVMMFTKSPVLGIDPDRRRLSFLPDGDKYSQQFMTLTGSERFILENERIIRNKKVLYLYEDGDKITLLRLTGADKDAETLLNYLSGKN